MANIQSRFCLPSSFIDLTVLLHGSKTERKLCCGAERKIENRWEFHFGGLISFSFLGFILVWRAFLCCVSGHIARVRWTSYKQHRKVSRQGLGCSKSFSWHGIKRWLRAESSTQDVPQLWKFFDRKLQLEPPWHCQRKPKTLWRRDWETLKTFIQKQPSIWLLFSMRKIHIRYSSPGEPR